ncbi:MAG: M20/M25/M40 family metallo-hydrolase [Chloroflexota bacterium]
MRYQAVLNYAMSPSEPSTTSIQLYLDEHLPGYLELLHQMVGVNSFSTNARGVDTLAELTAEIFASLGFDEKRVQSADFLYGQHLVLTRQGKPGADGQPAPVIGLISHLDTVYPAVEEEANDFHWRVEGDRIYGPGTVDIKGGTVMIYMILDTLRQFFPDVYNNVTWVVLVNAAEEALIVDFGDVCREHLQGARAALVFEGGQSDGQHYRIVTSRKGMARYHITVEGKSAHAGTSHASGANAIVQLADVIQQVADFTDYENDLTFNVGTILGGTVINRVPHQAAASVEMRAFTPDVFEVGVEKMLSLNDYCSVRSVQEGYPCRVRVMMTHRWEPWPENETTEQLLTYWQSAASALGWEIVPEARGGLSDGNLIWRDLPAIDGLGPSGGNAHSSERSEDGAKDQEYVQTSTFVPKAILNTFAILNLLDQGA